MKGRLAVAGDVRARSDRRSTGIDDLRLDVPGGRLLLGRRSVLEGDLSLLPGGDLDVLASWISSGGIGWRRGLDRGQWSRRDVLHVDDAVAIVITEGTERLPAG